MAHKPKKISPLIKGHLPEFVQEDHPLFIDFMEAYYEWMEESGNAIDANRSLLSYNDIDHTLEKFVTFFKKELMSSFPENILADKRKLLKHIKQFYRAKGTEKSYRLLFNVIFNSPVDFYYPHTNMLRASNGKWQQDKTLRVQAITGDPFHFVSGTIFGTSTNASAYVDEVKTIQIGPFFVYELLLNRSSILGTFAPGEIIRSESGIEARAYALFGGIDFESGDRGLNYEVGDTFTLNGGSGFFGEAEVTSVGTNGEILRIQVTDYGINYDTLPSFNIPGEIIVTTTNGINAVGELFSVAQTNAPGYYVNDDGKLNSADRLQDGFFYQQFSYVVYVNESIEQYRQIVKDVIHPAGLIMFGGLRTVNEVDAAAQLYPLGGTFIKLVFPRGIVSYDEDFLASTHLKVIPQISQSRESQSLGATAYSLDRDKFYHAPSSLLPDSASEMSGGLNAGYWDTYGNYQIQQFGDEIIGNYIGWDFVKVGFDPLIHTKQFLQSSVVGQILTSSNGTRIKVSSFELPKNTNKKGLMKLYFEYDTNNGISTADTLWIESNPSDEFYTSNGQVTGFDTNINKQINTQPEPRLSNNPQATVPFGHVW